MKNNYDIGLWFDRESVEDILSTLFSLYMFEDDKARSDDLWRLYFSIALAYRDSIDKARRVRLVSKKGRNKAK